MFKIHQLGAIVLLTTGFSYAQDEDWGDEVELEDDHCDMASKHELQQCADKSIYPTYGEQTKCFIKFNKNSEKCAKSWTASQECIDATKAFDPKCTKEFLHKYSEDCREALRDLTATCDNHTPQPYVWKTKSNKYVYNFSNAIKSWDDARKSCQNWNGDLASITREKDQKKIEEYLNNKDGSRKYKYWIGAHDSNREGHWQWADNRPLDYENWADGEPGQWGPIEDCAVMYEKERKWHDTKCFYWYRYICVKVEEVQGFLYELITPVLQPEPKVIEPEDVKEEEKDLGEKDNDGEEDEFEKSEEINKLNEEELKKLKPWEQEMARSQKDIDALNKQRGE